MQLSLEIRLEIVVVFFFERGGILSLCNFSLNIRLGECFVTHAWCAVSVFLQLGKFLVEAGGILSLCNYS